MPFLVICMRLLSDDSATLQSPDGTGHLGRRLTARRGAAGSRRAGLRTADPRVPRGVAAGCADLRDESLRRRGGRSGDLAGRPQRHRALRGALVVEDVDLPDPDEYREDASPARRPHAALLRTRATRTVPEPAVGPERFLPPDHERWPGHWSARPEPWPEDRLLAAETRSVVKEAIEALPPAQRAVISLRDIEGWSSDETCNALGLTETNQRVLLHRARSKVRQAVEGYVLEAA